MEQNLTPGRAKCDKFMIPASTIDKIALPAGNIRQIRDSGFEIGQNRNAGRQNTTILRQKSDKSPPLNP